MDGSYNDVLEIPTNNFSIEVWLMEIRMGFGHGCRLFSALGCMSRVNW